MLLTVLLLLLPPAAVFSGLRHWSYALHVVIVAGISWSQMPSLDLPLWHESYPYFIGAAHLASITLITFAAYGWDKHRAKWGGWRVPEKTLHALAFVGGTAGAYAGSRFFRHKTIKGAFRQMFWLVAMAQAMVILLVVWLF